MESGTEQLPNGMVYKLLRSTACNLLFGLHHIESAATKDRFIWHDTLKKYQIS